VTEIIEAMEREREKGKLIAIGLSNHSPAEVNDALATGTVTAVQARCSLLYVSEIDDLEGLAREHCFSMVAWGVLGQGVLTGKLDRSSSFGPDDHRSRASEFRGQRYVRALSVAEEVVRCSTRQRVSPAQVAIRWALDKPGVAVALAGAKTPQQVQDNVGAVRWRMERDEWVRLERTGSTRG
jgi:aryl-alcohol dehydrogenase-like predicted oxidoreductase